MSDTWRSISGDPSTEHPRFCSFENTSAPFSLNEYDALFKKPKYFPWDFNEYKDFKVRVSLFSDVLPWISITDNRIDLDRQFQERFLCIPHLLCRGWLRRPEF